VTTRCSSPSSRASMAPPKRQSDSQGVLSSFLAFLQGDQPPGAKSKDLGRTKWRCVFADCHAATDGKLNNAGNLVCFGCKRPKARAMNPPKALRCPPCEPTVSLKKNGNRKEPAGKSGSDGSAPAPPAATGKGSCNKKQDDEPGAVGKLFQAVAPVKDPVRHVPDSDKEKALGVTALADVPIEVLFRAPTVAHPPMRSPEELVAGASPMEASEALAAKQAQVDVAKQCLAMLPQDHDGRQGMVDTLVSLEASLAKMVKKAPGNKLQMAQLRIARSEQAAAWAAWEQVTEDGKSKAVAKRDQYLSFIDQQMAQLVERRKAVISAHQTAEAAWATHHAKRKDQWAALISQFDAKLLEMEATPAVDPAQCPIPIEVDESDEDPVEAARSQAKMAQEALAAAQQAVNRAVAEKEQAEKSCAALRESQLAGTFECTISELPKALGEPQAEHWPLLHNLWSALQLLQQHEAAVGAPIPITFQDLQAGLEVPRALLGDTIWAKAFPQDAPSLQSPVTVQLKQLLGLSLEVHRSKLAADKTRQDAAAATLQEPVASLVSAFKKRRSMASGS
jgi:hypothetical protein